MKANRGLEIRNRKLRKNTIKRNIVKPEQEQICRFVEIRYQIIEKVNGKFKNIGSEKIDGLQIRNRVYLDKFHYKLVNNKGCKIVRIYDDVPEWANQELQTLYNKFLSNLSNNN